MTLVAFVHYYVFYVRPFNALSDREISRIREAVTVCVDMPLIDWIPLRITPIKDEKGNMTAISASVFYGVTLYRINLRTTGGRLKGCSIEFSPEADDEPPTEYTVKWTPVTGQVLNEDKCFPQDERNALERSNEKEETYPFT
ncbi:MAG: hypothetical protein Cons2KO_33310 [Congregibacter sp.]